MAKKLMGNYSSETSYSVGDVVKENGNYYILLKSATAGTHPTDTRYWCQISDPATIDALDIAEDVQAGASDALEAKFPNAKTLVLASSTASSKKLFGITVIDDGTITATEITD